MSWNVKYAALILFSTVVTYVSAILIEQKGFEEGKFWEKLKKVALVMGIVLNLGVLFVFKYLDFSVDSINAVLSNFNVTLIENRFDLLLPVGISFYTFQALGYVIDVYRGDIEAEHNIFKYALLVSFFPQLVAGPIERSGKLMKQLNHADEIKLWNYERIV
ncbi:MAG: MBOAT family protein, partial [Clostridiales bacterium]|nr:MBOAT family protein [Clostridiales bacterium]